MRSLVTLDVVLSDLDPGALWGRGLDAPAAGETVDGARLAISGWALGRGAPVSKLELWSGARLLETVPVDQARPDVAQAFPAVAGAGRCGFAARLTLYDLGEQVVELRAVDAEGRRFTLARCHLLLREQALTPRADWVTVAPSAPGPRAPSRVRLFAVIGTWMEADVIAATIRNARTQGCERVYLVDNASTDETVAVALAEGAVLARRYASERYDEDLRLRLMNEVAAEVSRGEPDDRLWWLFLDADEFPHGPRGLTLAEYLGTLDERCRVVGARFFDHYPSSEAPLPPGRHPLDVQPLCVELSYPMCPRLHRKHPLVRLDRAGPRLECGPGFHVVHAEEQLVEPEQPILLHHFPFRGAAQTRQRLELLWQAGSGGGPRASAARDTHMLARFRSLDAVYAQRWDEVVNFLSSPPSRGVHLAPWAEAVEPEHQHVLRWYPMLGAWNYEGVPRFRYGDDTSYRRGMAFLDGHGEIEDWGCGFGEARRFVHRSAYVGLDGSSAHADRVVDLREYTSTTDCVFMRHVLEHNADWARVLANAVRSFKRRMVLVLFTPLADQTRQLASSTALTTFPVPDLSFRREDLTRHFAGIPFTEERLETDTQYGVEHVFYLDREQAVADAPPPPVPDAFRALRAELDAWRAEGLALRVFWRDDDASSDTPQLRALLALATRLGVEVALAVVPGRCDDGLVAALRGAPCCVWQHGWTHEFHADGEFGEGRAVEVLCAEALRGAALLDGRFGPAGWQRVFVPPNHALSMAFKARLPELGYLGVSAGEPESPPLSAVPQVDAMVDLMNWPAQRLASPARVVELLLAELRLRREGRRAPGEPLGLLTHHLAMDSEAWALVEALLALLRAHPAVTFAAPSSLLAAPAPGPRGRAKPGVAMVVTSCGRHDLLQRTLESFFAHASFPLDELIIVEDGEAPAGEALRSRFRDRACRWISTGRRVGQIAAIDHAYRGLRSEFIFHCEDDWEFFAPGFIERSLEVLQANPAVLQVGLRALSDTNGHPLLPPVLFAGDVPYRVFALDHHTAEWGTWSGFSFNPGLRRLKDYTALGAYSTFDLGGDKRSYEVEREIGAYYRGRGMVAAILADNDGRGYVRHLGWDRRVPEPARGRRG